MRLIRRALVVAAVVLAGAAAPDPALASCIQQTLTEQAAGAEVIAVGVVAETRQTFVAAGGVIRFRPERVLKGTLTREVQVYLGPSHGGAVTSVDYTAVVRGERHTLYLRAASDGSYETSACAGSHAGAQTADEEKALGAGTLVAAASDDAGAPPALIAALVVLVALALIAIAFGIRRRRARAL
jgi:hypothetical protein